MPRPSISYAEYLQEGRRKGLQLLDQSTPTSVQTPVRWRCMLTGMTFKKSYRAVKEKDFGTRYQREFADNIKQYRELAKQHGLELVFDDKDNFKGTNPFPTKTYFPANTKTDTLWRNKYGFVFEASYANLAYDPIPAWALAAMQHDPRLEETYVGS
jgi:hypothetical protein